MICLRLIKFAVAAAVTIFVFCLSLSAHAQTPGFTSKPLLVIPFTMDDSREIVVMSVTIAPGAAQPSHMHPGDCVGTVTEGNDEMLVAGKEPRRLAAGDAFNAPQGAVHQHTNIGDVPLRLINVMVVEKGKPRLQPAPMQPKQQ